MMDSMRDNTNNKALAVCGFAFIILAIAGMCLDALAQGRTAFNSANTCIIVVALIAVSLCGILSKPRDSADSRAHRGIDAETPRTLKVPLKKWGLFSGIVFLCWLPYIILVSPGTIAELDYFWQLMQGCGVLPLSNHHPVFGSLVFGALYQVGSMLGGASGGILMTTLSQAVLMAASIGYCLAMLSHLGLPKPFCVACLLFYGLCPVVMTHAVWAVKDSIFSSIALLFFFGCFLHIYSVKERLRAPALGSMPVLVLLAVLFSIYRNGTTIIAAMMLLMLLVVRYKHGERRREDLVRGLIPIVVFAVAILSYGLVIEACGVHPTNARESLGMPTRQIMASLKDNPGSFGEEDIETLETIYEERIRSGVSLSEMAQSDDYDALVADYIKPPWIDGHSLPDYIGVWLRVGIRNPGIYAYEALVGSYAYWWPGYDPVAVFHATPLGSVKQFCVLYDVENKPLREYFYPLPKSLEKQPELLDASLPECMASFPCLDGITAVDYNFPEAVDGIDAFFEQLKEVPGISLVLVPGFYTWIVLLSLAYCVGRKPEYALGLWPILLIVVMACLSPVNGYMRYVLPIVLFSWVLAGICLLPQLERALGTRAESKGAGCQ